MQRQAQADWEEIADRMSKLIPESLRSFASEKGWVRNEIDNSWFSLPEWLQFLVINTKTGIFSSGSIHGTDLPKYGFDSFDDLKAKFSELEQAWGGLIRIVVYDRHGYVNICYYATEVLNELERRTSNQDDHKETR
ncbi:TPA: hypothetical protein DCW61_01380 [Candidatus Uhrbacteria bacterium]|nr:hypothetical protein [Candidatus Uhrbacteria bacterium]